jgi:hypothetical protein
MALCKGDGAVLKFVVELVEVVDEPPSPGRLS